LQSAQPSSSAHENSFAKLRFADVDHKQEKNEVKKGENIFICTNKF